MIITSKDNKIIKLARKLHTKKERRENNLFLIEGEKLIKEAISAGVKLQFLLYKSGREPAFQVPDQTQLYEIPDHFMEFIATTDSAPPFLAIAETIERPGKKIKDCSLLLVVNGLQDPGNFGTIIRTAEAAAVDLIIAAKGTVDLFNPKVVRSSMGSVFRQPVRYTADLEELMAELAGEQWQFILTTPYSENDFYVPDYTGKTALFIGNEGQGLEKHLLERYQTIKIPMSGKVESLNTSIAASILLYEVVRQRKKLTHP
jgi:TrmH family RNA methyltransferase